jgi:hypothetical protein
MKYLNVLIQQAVKKYPYQEVEVDSFMVNFFKRVLDDREAPESAKEKANLALKNGLFKKDKIEDPAQIKKRKAYIKRLVFKAIAENKFTQLQTKKILKRYGNI